MCFFQYILKVYVNVKEGLHQELADVKNIQTTDFQLLVCDGFERANHAGQKAQNNVW